MWDLPARVYREQRLLAVLPFAALTIVAVLLTGRLTFDSGYGTIIPHDDEYRRAERAAQERFGGAEPIAVALETEGKTGSSLLERLEELRLAAEALPGVESTVGLTTLEDLFLTGSTLDRRRLYEPGGDAGTAVLDRVRATPLFRKLFLAHDGDAVFTYVIPAAGEHSVRLAATVIDRLQDTDVHFYGDPVVHHYVVSTAAREFVTLGLLALAIVLAIQIVIARSLLGGVILAVSSALPALWTISFFVLFGDPINITTSAVPVIVLVLATSYSIHVYRHVRQHDFAIEDALAEVTRVVLAAGITTVVGFVSLLVTPSEFLRQMGLYIVLGTLAAVAGGLFLLPQLLRLWDARRRRSVADRAEGTRIEPDVPVSDEALERPKPTVRTGVLPVRLVVFAAVVIAIGAGIPAVESRASYRDAFVDSHAVSRAVEYFRERTGADHELSVVMDTGSEYGLVDLATYERVRGFQESIDALPSGAYSVSYVDFVEWLLGRLDGSIEPAQPRDAAEIGEAMELLSGRGAGLPFSSLVDTEWRRTRVMVWANLATSGSATEDLAAIRRVAAGSLPGAEVGLFGRAAVNERRTHYLVRSQLLSVGLFFAFLATFLFLVFRDLRWVVVAALPTIVGVVVYLGFMGWLGILHDPTHVIMICAVLGVSNDDVLYYLIVFRRTSAASPDRDPYTITFHRTGVAIVQTTALIAIGVSVFYWSSVSYMSAAAALLTAGLSAATATTLVVVPWLLRAILADRSDGT
ncbi:MAG: efflux RND transporter permease subunit [Spirochaetota bacterium]